MKRIQSPKIRSLLRIKASNPYSDYIESENNLLGFLETFVDIAREAPESILEKIRCKKIIKRRQ
jgi:hypothetical protein